MINQSKKNTIENFYLRKVSTPNLSSSCPIKIKRKQFVEELANKKIIRKEKQKQKEKPTNLYKRKDVSGTPILKNSKIHKVSFNDDIDGNTLVDIISIESYKHYNIIEDDNETKISNKILSCRCILF